jgi:gluconolactonase
MLFLFFPLAFFGMVQASVKTLRGIDLDPELAYMLEYPYHAPLEGNFLDTKTSNASTNKIFKTAKKAAYYSFDPEFHDILGSKPTIELIASRSEPFAYEAGVWNPDRNEVWFTSSRTTTTPQFYSILDMKTRKIKTPKDSIQTGPNLAGADYRDGVMYFGAVGNRSIDATSAIYAIDTETHKSTPIINTYYGLPFNSIDDLAWVNPEEQQGYGARCRTPNLFFTSIDLSPQDGDVLGKAVLPNAVYRWTPSNKFVKAVIPRNEILAPNGIRVSPDGKFLYVTDAAMTTLSGPGVGTLGDGSPAVFSYELDENCDPVNKKLFALVRSRVADGIHVDNQGRVWTAEGNGIVVRNQSGRELGVFNGPWFSDGDEPMANFALAGDKLVVLALNRVFIIQLGQTVSTPARS